jgi:Flp pilus assembly protein TadG
MSARQETKVFTSRRGKDCPQTTHRKLVTTRRRRANGERGAVLVEAAIVLPLLLLLVLGVIEFSMAYKASNTVGSSVRAGARLGSAEARSSTFFTDIKAAVEASLQPTGQDTPISLWIYDSNANGFPNGAATMTCNTYCTAYTNWSVASHSFTTTTAGTAWTTGAAGTMHACATDTTTDSVGVYVVMTHSTLTGIFAAAVGKNSFTLSDKSIARLEPVPSGQLGCS